MFEEMRDYLDEMSKALQAINGKLGTVKINNINDSEDVQRALAEMEGIVDEKLSPFMTNPSVKQIAEAMKSDYRQRMLEAVEKKKAGAHRGA